MKQIQNEQSSVDERAASAVQARLRGELEYIERYVRLLRAKSTIHDRQVADINAVLHRVEIKQLPARHYDRIGQPYSPDEIRTLLNSIRSIEPEVYQTILGHEQRLDDLPSFDSDGPAAGHLDRLGEWVDYLAERLSDEPEDEEIENVTRNAMQEAQTADQELDEEDRVPPDALRALMTIAVDHALHAKIRERVDAMVYVRNQFEEIEVLARVATPNAEIDILRQGFILLMTAFDAAVFDLTRIKFRQKFFDFIGAFGKQEKVTLEEIGEAGSFEAFRDRVIEDQLKRRYVKDLLALLHNLGVRCTDKTGGDPHVRLIELVLRRNLHVHSRGIVDERYLEADPATAKPKYNLYDLKLGDTAVIDGAYLQNAVELSSAFVNALAKWSGK